MTHRVQRGIRIAALTTGVMVVLVGLSFAVLWLATRPTAQELAVQKGWEAGERFEAKVMQLADGERIDLAIAVGQPWERAVLLRAYHDGDDMNKIVGFPWWPSDHWSASDESQRMLAFIAGNTVVAQVGVSEETFRINEDGWDESDAAFVEIDLSDAIFVASRDADGFVTLIEP